MLFDRPPTPERTCFLAASLVAAATGTPLDDVLSCERAPAPLSQTRALAMYVAHVGGGLPISAVAKGFSRHRSTVSHACRQVEERREASGFDRKVGVLESALRGVISREMSDAA